MMKEDNTFRTTDDNLMSELLSNGTMDPNTTAAPVQLTPCQWILYADIGNSRVRVWDLIILIPNALFLLFLLLRLRSAIRKLQRTNSPNFFAFYGLVMMVASVSVLRCVVSMTANATLPAGHIADKVLWLVVRFFLLATELSVVIFGLAFGHLDSRTSVQRVLLVTFSTALIYSTTQGILEFMYSDRRFSGSDDLNYNIFGHGGMLFWFISSVFFTVIYATVCILPFTKLKERFALPSKKAFYWYSFILCILNVTQSIGSGLLYYEVQDGLCVVDVTSYLYFSFFAPLVYGTFLWNFFADSRPLGVLFSYKPYTDEPEEEENSVSLPQNFYPATKHDDNVASGSYDSTHFDAPSPNPLYASDLTYNAMNPGELRFSPEYFTDNNEGNSSEGYREPKVIISGSVDADRHVIT